MSHDNNDQRPDNHAYTIHGQSPDNSNSCPTVKEWPYIQQASVLVLKLNDDNW